ncbi:MAG: TolC family outer membrane protein [Magnetococcales bacterium]|nr:TolC family outer membrane protein [Magnetococcales bacterium]MBF0156309.1 TolC family outer membrane protein [Magnetococcales bacterium]
MTLRPTPIFALMLTLALPMTSEARSLQEAVTEMLANNPELAATRNSQRAASEMIGEARAHFYPSLDFSLGGGREWSDTPATQAAATTGTMTRTERGVTLIQPIFDGFSNQSGLTKAEAQARVAEFEFRVVRENLVQETVAVFIETMKQMKLMEFAETNVELHRRIHKGVTELARLGLGAEIDATQAQARVDLALSELASGQMEYERVEASLIRLTGDASVSKEEPTLPAALLPGDLAQARQKAVENHPSIQKLYWELQAAKAEHSGSQAGFWPKVDVAVGMTQNNNSGGMEGLAKNASAMVRMTYNLFRGGADTSIQNQGIQQVARAEKNWENTRLEVSERVTSAWQAWKRLQERISHLDHHLQVTSSVTAAYHEQFQMGQRTLLDLLNSENELFDARRSLAETRFELVKSGFVLLGEMGILTKVLLDKASGENSTPQKKAPPGAVEARASDTARPLPTRASSERNKPRPGDEAPILENIRRYFPDGV